VLGSFLVDSGLCATTRTKFFSLHVARVIGPRIAKVFVFAVEIFSRDVAEEALLLTPWSERSPFESRHRFFVGSFCRPAKRCNDLMLVHKPCFGCGHRQGIRHDGKQ
jgi:hypothetical protein